jgi:hypothetical protein
LQRGIAQGVFRPVDAQVTARAISLQLDGIFYASQARGDALIEQDIENLCQIVNGPALAARAGRTSLCEQKEAKKLF